MRFGFDSPDLKGPAEREARLWLLERITTAARAVVEGGGEEENARALVVEDGMGEGVAWRFVDHFRPHVSAMVEALQEGGGDPAAIAHAWGMTKAERIGWHRVAEDLPLSGRHAGHSLSRLKRRAA